MPISGLQHIKDTTDPLVGPGTIETYRGLRERLKEGRDAKIIQIPVHPKEKNLQQLLQMYVDRPDLHGRPFRLILLINNGTPEETEERLSEIENFTGVYPDFPLECYFSRIPGTFQTISQVRAAIARLALEKLPDQQPDTLSHAIFVTHDADMVEIYPDYFRNIDTAFGDSRLYAIGGGIEFRTDSPLLRTLYKVDDEFYKQELNRSHIKPKMCGANSVFRAAAYVHSGGYDPRYLRKESAPIRDYLLRNLGVEAVRHRSDVVIATSARRTLECLNSGGSFSYQHGSFGRPGDYMDSYMDCAPDKLLADSGNESEKFAFLADQLTGMLWKSLYLEACFLDKRVYKSRKKGVKTMIPYSYILENAGLAEMRARHALMFETACRRSGLGIQISPEMKVCVMSYPEDIIDL